MTFLLHRCGWRRSILLISCRLQSVSLYVEVCKCIVQYCVGHVGI